MAIFRKRSSPFARMLVVVGGAWIFLLFLISVYNLSDMDLIQYSYEENKEKSSHSAGGVDHPPVLEKPDKLRFQEAVQHDLNINSKSANSISTINFHKGNEAAQKLLPSFMEKFQQKPTVNNNSSAAAVRGMKGVDERMIQLIEQGLIVPKWHLSKEVPVGNMSGENGEGVTVMESKLTPEQKKRYDEGWKNNAFNEYASTLMSLHRSLRDYRDKECLTQPYRAEMNAASVIIIFHNEAQSVLYRTFHSVMDRSPPHLLNEIILVDDCSTFDHLKKPLEDYIKPLYKIKLIRAKKRDGLIRARLLGASIATSKVLVFLDSHCECALGWLEPLLDRLAHNWSTVVTPIIDVLSDSTLKFQHTSARSTQVGGFDWNLQFNWHAIPKWEREKHRNIVEPVWSPTMAGGLFAINRDYFEYLGAYDPGMDIWGGENLELSFKIWMCGGTLEQVLCSHVAHIFRKRSPYSWRAGTNVLRKNSIRLAEVWMDDYKKYYYERFNFKLGDYGDISSRVELRKRLKCKSFDWYVRNIFPELFIPGDALVTGEIRCKALVGDKKRAMCVDGPADKKSYGTTIKLWPCHKQGGNQHWMMSVTGEIRRDQGCLDYSGRDVQILACHGAKGNQKWSYDNDNKIRHTTGKCLAISKDGSRLIMEPCSATDHQVWVWERKSSNSSTTIAPR